MKEKEITMLDGRTVSSENAKCALSDPGFLYGFGLFETMRAYNSRIVYLDKHIQRLRDSAKVLKIRFASSESFIKSIKEAIKESKFSDARVRLTLWKTNDASSSLITVKKYTPYSAATYKKGFSLAAATQRQNEGSFLSKIKNNNRILYDVALEEARAKGCDEAILLNNSGYVAEASRSNIFTVKGDKLFTPSIECGCLNGITRQAIFNLAAKSKIKVEEGSLTVQDLYNSQGVFLTNSLMGVMPAYSLEGHVIPKSKVIDLLRQKYQILIKNGR